MSYRIKWEWEVHKEIEDAKQKVAKLESITFRQYNYMKALSHQMPQWWKDKFAHYQGKSMETKLQSSYKRGIEDE